MAKGLRSASKRRCRAVKRQHVQQTIEKERLEKLHTRLQQLQQGVSLSFSDITPLNAFLHPGTYGAVFPQQKPGERPLDFRSEHLGVLAGLATSHNRRKYTAEEEEELMKTYGHLPGKTEDPRTQQLRRKVLSSSLPSAARREDTGREKKKKKMEGEFEEATMEEETQPRQESRTDDRGESRGTAAGATGGGGGGAGTGESRSENLSSMVQQSMMLTPEMEEMMKQRRKAETMKIPVPINNLKKRKDPTKRSSIKKKSKRPPAKRRR